MVKGIEKFREAFKDYAGQYVFIGGTACDVILGKNNADFRSTKDLDIVLVMELLNEDFIGTFIRFIEDGGYQHINKGTGENQFYRFQNPADSTYPVMIELFSRKPDYLQALDRRLAPVHVSDDVISLSAILLDDEYYQLLRKGAVEVDGLSVLDLEYLILFKMKAWLDLSARKNSGEAVDSRNIRKHKKDVIRLAANLDPDTRLPVYGQVKEDALHFLTCLEEEPVLMETLGLRGISFPMITERLRRCYMLTDGQW